MMQGLPQIVAATLGIGPDDVIVRAADTDAAGYDVGVGGGRTTVALGAASLEAAQEVCNKLLKVASEMIEAAPGSGRLIAEVATYAQAQYGPIAGTGASTRNGAPAMPGCVAGHFIDAIDIPSFAVHDCEVAVDRETWHVEVLSYHVVQDEGRAAEPARHLRSSSRRRRARPGLCLPRGGHDRREWPGAPE
jgi:CO/xanthine dehydrogenase Mo-binding subunit